MVINEQLLAATPQPGPLVASWRSSIELGAGSVQVENATTADGTAAAAENSAAPERYRVSGKRGARLRKEAARVGQRERHADTATAERFHACPASGALS